MKIAFNTNLEEETEEDRIIRWETDHDGCCSGDCPCRDDDFCIILQHTVVINKPCPVLRLHWALNERCKA